MVDMTQYLLTVMQDFPGFTYPSLGITLRQTLHTNNSGTYNQHIKNHICIS